LPVVSCHLKSEVLLRSPPAFVVVMGSVAL
jgi:hypothetical protein